jgi:putative MATE family efflux protein
MARMNLLEGKVGKTLFWLTLPMMFGHLSVIGVSLVDAFFIGKLGHLQLAAFGFIFPVIFTFNGIIIGIGSGAAALSARAFGAKDMQAVRRLTTDALLLGVSIIATLSLIGLFTIHPLFTMLGAKPEVLPFIEEYMRVWYFGSIFVVFPMIGNSAMTATGNTKTPAILMGLVVIINSILDPIVIFGAGPIPALGFAGAAWTAVISRVTVFFLTIYVLAFRDKVIDFVKPRLSDVFNSWKRILYIGLPNGATNIIVPLGFGIITKIAAKYSLEAVAALAVAERVEALSVTALISLAVSLSPFVGQNLGAKQFDRIRTAIRKAYQFSFYWGAFLLIALFVFSGHIITNFSTEPKVIEYFKNYFHFVPFSYGMLGVIYMSGVTLNVFNKPLHSAALTVTRVFIAYVPLALLLTSIYGVNGIFYSALAANIVTGALAMLTLRKQTGKVLTSAIAS